MNEKELMKEFQRKVEYCVEFEKEKEIECDLENSKKIEVLNKMIRDREKQIDFIKRCILAEKFCEEYEILNEYSKKSNVLKMDSMETKDFIRLVRIIKGHLNNGEM